MHPYKIAQEYVDGATLQELARSYRCPLYKIVRALDEAGIERRKAGRRPGITPSDLVPRNRQILEYRKEGKSCRQIARIYGLSFQRVATIIARGY